MLAKLFDSCYLAACSFVKFASEQRKQCRGQRYCVREEKDREISRLTAREKQKHCRVGSRIEIFFKENRSVLRIWHFHTVQMADLRD